jgi:putative DNA primase/helicase
VARFDSYCEISPSQTGLKIFFIYDSGDLPTLRATMNGAEFGKQFKREGGDHPPAIELHLGNRYFAVTDEPIAGSPVELRHVDTSVLLDLINVVGPAFAAASSTSEKPRKGRIPTDRSRSALAFRKGKELRQAGASFQEMVAGLLADPDTAEWTREKGSTQDNRELKRICAKAATPGSVDGYDLTEDGIGLTYAKAHQDLLRYDHSTGRWQGVATGRNQASVFVGTPHMPPARQGSGGRGQASRRSSPRRPPPPP